MEPTSNIQPNEIQQPVIENVVPVKKKLPWLLIIIIFLSGVLLTLIGYFVYTEYLKPKNLGQQNTNNNANQEENNNNNANNEENENNVEPEDVALSRDKIFYVKYTDKNNIYSYDLNSKNHIKLTKFSDNTDVKSLNVFGSNFLSYGVCKTVTNDFGCSLKYFDLNTQVETELLKLPKTSLLQKFEAYSTDKYAYLVTTNKAGTLDKFQLTYVNNGSVKLLENLSIGEGYGRGGFVEDSERVKFSPNGIYLLHISTSSPRDTIDFNTYVYDLNAGTKIKISESTHPNWINNTTIIFRRPKQANEGLYLFDLDTKLTSKIEGIQKNSYDPRVSIDAKSILFTDYDSLKVYVYDLDSKKILAQIEKGADALWINENTFAYIKAENCVGNEDECGMGPFKTTKVSLYNTTTNETLDLSLESMYLITSIVDNR